MQESQVKPQHLIRKHRTKPSWWAPRNWHAAHSQLLRTKGLLLIINHKFISSKSGLTTSTTTNKRFGTSTFIESGAGDMELCWLYMPTKYKPGRAALKPAQTGHGHENIPIKGTKTPDPNYLGIKWGIQHLCSSCTAQLHQCPTFRKRFLVLAGSTATLCISATPLAPCPCVVPGALLLLPTSSTTGGLVL